MISMESPRGRTYPFSRSGPYSSLAVDVMMMSASRLRLTKACAKASSWLGSSGETTTATWGYACR